MTVGVRERGDAFNALPPGASPAVASLPRSLRFAKWTVSSEPLIAQIFADRAMMPRALLSPGSGFPPARE